MITLILRGGLGNQMFQYAAACALADKLNANVIIDLSFLENRVPIPGFTYRNYELDLFDLNLTTTTFLKNDYLDKYFSYPLEKAYATLVKRIYTETDPYEFNKDFFLLTDGTYIEGYFNNYKYFESIKDKIKELYNTEKLVDEKYSEIENKIARANSVSINIRRGDYLNKKHKEVYTFLDESYYLRAIDIVKSKIENPHFFVFSYDDPEWFKQALKLADNEFTYIGKEFTGDRFKTYLRLISLCKHNIISNSTFAWWGAYLNKNENKLVITPDKWAYKYKFENVKSWEEIKI